MSNPADPSAALRRAATIIQKLERQLDAARLAVAEPVAVVGVGCRLPGGVSSLSSFWQLLRRGADTVRPMPAGRFGTHDFYDADPDAPGKSYVRGGSFLDDIEGFDAEFWGIGSDRAALLDPQHRLLLECSWEALEHSGIVLGALKGSAVGVFVGTASNEFGYRVTTDSDLPLEAFAARMGQSFSAGRLSLTMDLKGPALAVDTACSSSLVALHSACQALRSRECEVALAAGVQVMLSPDPFIWLSRLHGLSADGRCKSFSEKADGYGRGEGCVVLALKRLSDARAAGDRILCLIRGSAVNHDGLRSGLATPTGDGQRTVIQQALANAHLHPSDIDYVEPHAIGTALGDAIELESLARAYGPGRSVPLWVGSLKAAVGHLEPASGIAGVLKVITSLQHEALPPSPHALPLSSLVNWSELPIRVLEQVEPWPRSERPRRAGVSAYGLSGTNSHVVLEEAPETAELAQAKPRRAELVVVSAKSPEALRGMTERLHFHLEVRANVDLADVAHSLATTRSLMEHRTAFVVSTADGLREVLQQEAAGLVPRGVSRGQAIESTGKMLWLFASDYPVLPGMGRELYEEWPAFRQSLDAAVAVIDPLLKRSLHDLLWARPNTPEASFLEHAPFAQCARFALEWAMSQLWQSWGVTPELVAGHFTGEICAACTAGVVSLADAARLVVATCARPLSDENVRSVRSVVSSSGSIPLLSNVTGKPLAEHQRQNYWERPWTPPPASPALLAQAAGADRWLELGPVTASFHCAATAEPAADPIASHDAAAPESAAVLSALGRWIVTGGAPRWENVLAQGARRIELPTYAWQRRRHTLP
jgi:acyl transferase domain-containing protein